MQTVKIGQDTYFPRKDFELDFPVGVSPNNFHLNWFPYKVSVKYDEKYKPRGLVFKVYGTSAGNALFHHRQPKLTVCVNGRMDRVISDL